MVCGQKWPFLQLLFLSKIGQENFFYDILERKNPFLGYINKKFKKGKIAIFPKGLTHGFGRKNAHFFNLCFTIFENERRPFQAIKTRSLKSGKIGIFLKGLTHRFWTKMAFFATSFCQAKQANKMSLTIFQNGKTPFWALKKEVKKVEKLPFFQRG